MNALRNLILVMTVLLCTACSTIKTGADIDAAADFSEYRTAAWLYEGILVAPNSEDISPLMDRRIRDAVNAQLGQRGILVLDHADEADLVIAVVIGAREKIDLAGYPSNFRGHAHVCGPNCYDLRSTPRIYTQGTLSLDLYDTRSGDPVWHAWIKKSITQTDREDPTTVTNEAIEKMFGHFPKVRRAGS